MKIIAKIELDGRSRQLMYSAGLVVENVPLCDSNINIMEQIGLLDKVHKTIEAAVKEINDRHVGNASMEPVTYIRTSPTSSPD